MIHELIERYKHQMDVYTTEIEQYCSQKERSGAAPKSPSYVLDVIIPVMEKLATLFKRPKIRIPEPTAYYPIKNYYRIKVGMAMLGGFSVPEDGCYDLYFTPLRYGKPTGEKIKIEKIEQLRDVIAETVRKNSVAFNDLNNEQKLK